jgi:hypothetical protein
MGKPDALSRRADHGSGTDDNSNITLLTPGFFAVRALEGLEVIGEERDILKDIRKGTRDAENEEAIAKVVKELKASRGKSVRSAEWSLDQEILYFRGKAYVPDSLDLRRRISKTPSVWHVWSQTCQTVPDFHIWYGDIMTLPVP